MKIPIFLSELITNDDFEKGNELYKNGGVIINSKESFEDNSFVVKGFCKGSSPIEVVLKIKEGKILFHSCNEHKNSKEMCFHTIALALKYNELILADEKPVSSLSEIVKGDITPNYFEKTEMIFLRSGELTFVSKTLFSQLEMLLKQLDEKDYSLLLPLFANRFVFKNKELIFKEEPLPLFYFYEDRFLRFELPPKFVFFQNTGVLFDGENSFVYAFSKNQTEILSNLLSVNASYESKEELYPVISNLQEKISSFIVLKGYLASEYEVAQHFDIISKIHFNKKNLSLSVVCKMEKGEILFNPSRKMADQIYTIENTLIKLNPDTVRLIKTSAQKSGFRYSAKKWTAPMSTLSNLLEKKTALNEIGEVVFDKEIKRMNMSSYDVSSSEIEIKMQEGKDWFSFSLKLPELDTPVSPKSIAQAMQTVANGNENPVIFDENDNPVILEQSADFLKRLYEMLAFGNALPGSEIKNYYLPQILAKKPKIKFADSVPDETISRYKTIIENFRTGKIPEVEIPKSVSKLLRKYQIDGIKWMTLLRNSGFCGILADEMGLGKTIQALTVLKNIDSDKTSLVIVPKTLIWSWDMEIKKFYPEMKRIVIDSFPPEERLKLWKKSDAKLVITSYSIVSNDFAVLKNKVFDTIILDEAQHIKNPSTKRYKFITQLNARFKMALTGTPIENGLKELWSVFNFLMPGYLGAKKEVEKIEKNGDEQAFEKLASLASPFILRRTKNKILTELPDIIFKDYPVDMAQKQKELYLSLLLRGRAEFLEYGENMNKMQILSLLTKLRLAANHPALASDNFSINDPSGKILILMELVDEILSSGGKVLIFSQFVKMLKIIEHYLQKNKIDYFYMDGSTKNRIELVNDFNSGEKSVFLLSLKVGGLGLNLTGADNIILVDPWWNPAVEQQAFARAHRIGQTKNVVVNKLFTRESIEEKIITLQEKKKNLTDFFLSRAMNEPSKDFIKMLAEMELDSFGDKIV